MFPMMPVSRKTGNEQFRQRAIPPLGFDLLSFWQWSGSDLLGIRAQLAEYIVARALGLGDGMCSGWGSHDLQTSTGLKIEVKSSAYLQGWAQKSHTKPLFSIKGARIGTRPAKWERMQNDRRIYMFSHCLFIKTRQRLTLLT